MISRLFDNDETFPKRFLDYWESYRAIPAGRPEEMLKQMVYFHNCLFPDFQISECLNCGSRWKRAEDRLDLAYSIMKPEFDYVVGLIEEVQAENSTEEQVEEPVVKKTTKKK